VGWAGPTNWAELSPKRVGPISAQKWGWADLGPIVHSSSSGLGRSRPRPKGWARIGLAQEGKNEEGNYFPLPSPACRTIFRSTCRRK